MASSSALVLLLVVSFLAVSCIVHAATDREEEEEEKHDLVARTCANATSNFCHIHLKTKYCVSTLRSDTRSARAQEPRDLALLAIDLARRGAAAADAKAAALLPTMPSEEAARVLRYCRSDYASVARLAAMCRGTVEAYGLRDDGKRDTKKMYYNNECARKLVAAAKKCAHLGLYVEELDEALRREFIDVARRAALAKAVVEVMVGIIDPVEGFNNEFDSTFIDE